MQSASGFFCIKKQAVSGGRSEGKEILPDRHISVCHISSGSHYAPTSSILPPNHGVAMSLTHGVSSSRISLCVSLGATEWRCRGQPAPTEGSRGLGEPQKGIELRSCDVVRTTIPPPYHPPCPLPHKKTSISWQEILKSVQR